MSKRNVIVVGASAGGMEVMRQLLSQLPDNFPAAIFIVWHMSRDYPSHLAQILSHSTSLPVSQPKDGEEIQWGRVYVPRPDHHLILEGGYIRITKGPSENRFRPSVDVLFRSAALAYGPRVISVILSGSLDDGAAGCYAVKQQGGITIVQDPIEAPYFDMPVHAMKAAKIDHVLPVGKIGNQLVELVNQDSPSQEQYPASEAMKIEVNIASDDHALELGSTRLGEASIFTCPECHGTLLKIQDGGQPRFRCHVGHAFSLNTLLVEITKSIEKTLVSGIRAIEESQLLLEHMAQHLEVGKHFEAAQAFWNKAQQAKVQAESARQVMLQNEVLSQEKIERH